MEMAKFNEKYENYLKKIEKEMGRKWNWRKVLQFSNWAYGQKSPSWSQFVLPVRRQLWYFWVLFVDQLAANGRKQIKWTERKISAI